MDKGLAYSLLKAKYPNGHPDFIPLCLEEMKLHSEKNYDYAYGGHPLGNFHRVSSLFNLWGLDVPPWLVALTYMMKQVDAVGTMLGQNYEGKIEGISDRLRDISVYAKLIDILYKEGETWVIC